VRAQKRVRWEREIWNARSALWIGTKERGIASRAPDPQRGCDFDDSELPLRGERVPSNGRAAITRPLARKPKVLAAPLSVPNHNPHGPADGQLQWNISRADVSVQESLMIARNDPYEQWE